MNVPLFKLNLFKDKGRARFLSNLKGDKKMNYSKNVLKLNNENKKELKVIELCAGIGQTSIALQQACEALGIKVVLKAFCEIDKFATQGYRALHPNVMEWIEDMTKASFKGRYCDVLLATTPCQGFSLLGKRDGFKKVKGNDSAIIWHTFRLLDELEEKPKIIFFENVKGMLSKKNQKDFQIFVSELKKRGYKVQYKVLDAQDYGVPQHRERVYIVATLDDVEFDFPTKEVLKVFLKDILEKDVSSKFMMRNMEKKINGCNGRNRSVRVHNPSYTRVAYTLTTKSRGQNNNNYVYLDDVSSDEIIRFTPQKSSSLNKFKKYPIRSLSRLEQARLMGMSDEDAHKLDFISNTQFSKQMGNGVVIPVVAKIFVNVLKAYMEQYDDFLMEEQERKVA